MANHVSRLIHMKGDKMQNGKLCVQLTHTKKGCKWNDMPIHTHYQNITCLTLLSWLMTSNIIKYVKYTYFKIHIWLHMIKCICTHPPKVFIQAWIKHTQMGRRKTRGRCESRNRHTKHNKEERKKM